MFWLLGETCDGLAIEACFYVRKTCCKAVCNFNHVVPTETGARYSKFHSQLDRCASVTSEPIKLRIKFGKCLYGTLETMNKI